MAPSYHKQGSSLSKGQFLHLGPLRHKSRQVHKVSPLERPASSSLVVTPVPFAPTGAMFFKEASLLGNTSFLPKHVGVSSVSQSDSVANVRDVPAVVTSPPVRGKLQVFWQARASMGASQAEPFAGVGSVLPCKTGHRNSTQPVLPRVLQPPLFGSKTKQMAAHFGSQCSEPVSACKNLQDGNSRVHKVVYSARGMGLVTRL